MDAEQTRAAEFLRQAGFVVQGPGDRGYEKTILDERYFRKIIPYAGEMVSGRSTSSLCALPSGTFQVAGR